MILDRSGLCGLFITGVDTGVGKTFIGAGLIAALRSKGIHLQPKKPVESACASGPDGLIPADAIRYWEATGRSGLLEDICKFAFPALAAPDRAARLSGAPLSLGELLAFCTECKGSRHPVLVEGAGGFCSPIAEDGLNADLAEKLGLPIVVVALDKLGCINHTLLTVEAIHRRGLEPAAVVLNVYPAPPEGDMDNAKDLRRWLDVPVFSVTTFDSPEFAELIEYLNGKIGRPAGAA